jgi:phage replication-related protein YjqB (UPF0714/DUF867 family)
MLQLLLAEPGVIETSELRSRVGFMALHGGSLERMTDVIAIEAAEGAGASVYAITQPRNLRWHIPSHRLHPGASAALARFLEHIDVVVSLHGWGSRGQVEPPVLLGGRNREMAAGLRHRLSEALPSYAFVDDLDTIPAGMRGLHARNPVNRPRQAGVQVELPPRIRGLPPHWGPDRSGRDCPDVEVLIETLAAWPA